MRGIILYMSKKGSTKQYADWISEETGFPTIDLKNINKPDLKHIDIIIIGSWILAARMVAHGWIKKNWSKISDKNVIIFSVGGDEPNDELKKKYMDSSLPEDAKDRISFYTYQGRFRQEDQNVFLRGMLNLAVKFEKEDDLAQNMVKGVDGVKRENLDEMFDYIRSLS
jgi:menaquinone-dependent protoporphyrinogen IX oxidase